MTVSVNSANIDLSTLLYTGLYNFKEDFTYELIDGMYIFSCTSNCELISEAIEIHEELAGDYSLVVNELFSNAQIEMSKAIENLLDTTSQTYRYDDMKSVRSYTGFDNVFRDECIKLATWGSDCWVVAGQIEYDVLNGNRAMPTVEELINELPTYTV